jgi:hypothetical protein
MLYFLLSLFASPVLYALIAFHKQKPSLQADKEGHPRILVIQSAKIGDLVYATPVFREIRKKYPHAYIAVAANPEATGIIKNNPHINEIISVESRSWCVTTAYAKLCISRISGS